MLSYLMEKYEIFIIYGKQGQSEEFGPVLYTFYIFLRGFFEDFYTFFILFPTLLVKNFFGHILLVFRSFS
jgi:hypothetical protein